MTFKELLGDEKFKSSVWLATKVIVIAFWMMFTLLWATTDKTAFYHRLHIASYESVESMEKKIDSLLTLATATKNQVVNLTNGRMMDLYESGIQNNQRITDPHKFDIYRGLFERHDITLDSLRVLIRDYAKPVS